MSSHLRLHVEATPARGESAADEMAADEMAEFAPICDAFRGVTGWSLQFEALPEGRNALGEEGESTGMPRPRLAFHLRPAPSEGGEPPIALSEARSLAKVLADSLGELSETRRAISHREAEMAAGVPVTAHVREEEHLAARLEAILKGGARAVGCVAAAAYLLDDATTELKMRTGWGLPQQRLLDPPRPLRGSVADLEALVGHSVVIEDVHAMPHWKVPEPYAAAVCVPISSPTEPLGTLWFFAEQARGFTEEQVDLIEIIAGRVAAELQRAVLLSECVQTKRLDQQVRRAVQWQGDRLPSVTPLFDDWTVAGWSGHEEVLSGGFYDWFVPADGTFAVATGRSEGSMLEAAMTSAALHGTLRAHSHYPHSAAEMVNRVNETVWNSSAGGQFASLFYTRIDPQTGDVECCSAGSLEALVLTGAGAQYVESTHPPLGSLPGDVYRSQRYVLGRGDSLLILCAAPSADRGKAQGGTFRAAISGVLDQLRDASPAQLVEAVGSVLDRTVDSAADGRPMALVVQRR